MEGQINKTTRLNIFIIKILIIWSFNAHAGIIGNNINVPNLFIGLFFMIILFGFIELWFSFLKTISEDNDKKTDAKRKKHHKE